MSGWGCPNELNGTCLRVNGRSCDPGMKGCVLRGRFVFSNPEKNPPPARTRLLTGAPPSSRASAAADD